MSRTTGPTTQVDKFRIEGLATNSALRVLRDFLKPRKTFFTGTHGKPVWP